MLAILAGLVAATVVVVYRPVLSARAVCLDDDLYLTNNPLVQNAGLGSVYRVFAQISAPLVPGYYEPLSVISLMLDYARGGRMDALGPFHQTSLALHAANAALVVVLLYLLLRLAKPVPNPPAEGEVAADSRRDTGILAAAAMAGLLFGLHSLTVEPVALVAQRKVLLATFFSLGSLILYARYCGDGRRGYLGGALALYFLALLSKPTSTPLPLLMLLLDFWPLRRLGWGAIREKERFFILGAVFAVITVAACARTSGITLPGESSVMQGMLTVPYLAFFYLCKIVWPGSLSCVYPLPQPFTLWTPAVLFSVVGACAVLVVIIVSLRWTRALVTGSLFFLVAVFPTMGAIGYTWVTAADKHVYLASVGPLLIVAWALSGLWAAAVRSRRRVAIQAAVLAGVMLLADGEARQTRRYIARWSNTEGLYLYMLDLAPGASILHYNLANTLAHENRLAEAVQHYVQALHLKPGYPEAHNNMALALARSGDPDRAVEHLREALRLRPRYAEAENNLGMMLARQGKDEEAASHFAKALEIKPRYLEAHNNLANTLLARGRAGEAVAHYEESLRLDPDSLVARINLGVALSQEGKSAEALRAFEEAVRRHPDDATARFALGVALEDRGRMGEAIEEYQRVLQVDPAHSEARQRLEAATRQQGAATKP